MFNTEFWSVGTAYAYFRLDWNMVYLSTDDESVETIHFYIVSTEYDGIYLLNSPAQKVFRLRIQRMNSGKLYIQSIALTDWIEAARAEALVQGTPLRCTIIRFFRNAEWEQYGKIGTWDHFWVYLPWWLDRMVAEWFPI